jgi:methylenetetrahydrofolate dehydrogenase (NADP+)/methenyltetrahydrofolate cyclohydrolase
MQAEALKKRGVVPCLAVLLVGKDPGSVSYVKGLQKAFSETGMAFRDICFPASVTEAELLGHISSLNADEELHAILMQLPLPAHIREERVIIAIDPRKDVDCFHPESMGKLLLGQDGFLPCTPHGVLVLLQELKVQVSGSDVVVVGRSNIVGKPLSLLLARKERKTGLPGSLPGDATVTICHTGTKDLASYTRRADILIAAAGKAGLITGDMIKPGAAVIDVGVNSVSVPSGTKLVGDVDFEQAQEIAGWITPVPGGVGPMTITMLMRNVLRAAENCE